MKPNSDKRFYCESGTQTLGPFDLVELAAELKYGTIGPDTSVRPESETEWSTFHKLPEFDLATHMPVEEIARQLDAKERVGVVPVQRSPRSTTFWLATMGALVVGGSIVAYVLSSDKPSPASPPVEESLFDKSSEPTPLAWVKTADDGFSLECPVPLHRIAAAHSGVISYRGMAWLAGFGVDLSTAPGNYTDDEYQMALSRAEAGLFDLLHANVSSNLEVTVNGYHGRDYLFTHTAGKTNMAGGARFLGGKNVVAVAWVTAKSSTFSPEAIDRFLKSFQLK